MTHGERLDRLEQIVHILAEDQMSLQKIVVDLARETRVGFEQVNAQFKETDRRLDERFRQTDERFDKLVVALGEFIRRQNESKR